MHFQQNAAQHKAYLSMVNFFSLNYNMKYWNSGRFAAQLNI